MKRVLKLFSILVIAILAVTLLTGCGKKEKKEELTFDGEEGKITFQVKEDANYKISTEQEDLRTSREQGVLIGDNFKIGIEFCDDYKYFFDSNLDKLKENRSDRDEYKEVKYGGVDGVQYFYGSYNCYEVMLPVANDENYYLNLSIYGSEDKEESAKAAIANEELLEILNSIKFEAKSK